MTRNTERLQGAIDRFNKLARNLREESDRAMAILGVAYLDDLLRESILSLLVEGDVSDNLFRGYGPLATLSARIDMAFVLGLFGEGERRELNLLRKIRNEFAHSTEIHSFDAAPVRDWCSHLGSHDTFAGRPVESLHGGSVERTAFFVTILEAAQHLMFSTEELSPGRPARKATDSGPAPEGGPGAPDTAALE